MLQHLAGIIAGLRTDIHQAESILARLLEQGHAVPLPATPPELHLPAHTSTPPAPGEFPSEEEYHEEEYEDLPEEDDDELLEEENEEPPDVDEDSEDYDWSEAFMADDSVDLVDHGFPQWNQLLRPLEPKGTAWVLYVLHLEGKGLPRPCAKVGWTKSMQERVINLRSKIRTKTGTYPAIRIITWETLIPSVALQAENDIKAAFRAHRWQHEHNPHRHEIFALDPMELADALPRYIRKARREVHQVLKINRAGKVAPA